jgi:large subunit ribosomal protein L17
MYSHIETTEPRAKEAQPIVEKLITLAKQNTVHARREARKILPPPHAPKGMHRAMGKAQKKMREEMIAQDPVKRLFDVVGPKFADRQGGYTRMTKIGLRRGDAAPVVKLELAED